MSEQTDEFNAVYRSTIEVAQRDLALARERRAEMDRRLKLLPILITNLTRLLSDPPVEPGPP